MDVSLGALLIFVAPLAGIAAATFLVVVLIRRRRP